VLPAFPGLAFLTADALVRCFRKQSHYLQRPIFKFAMIVWTVAALGLAAGPWFFLTLTRANQFTVGGFLAFSVAGILYAAVVLFWFYRKRFEVMAVFMGVGMAFMIAILYAAVFPNLNYIHLSKRLADDLIRLGAYGKDVPVAAVGYGEPGWPSTKVAVFIRPPTIYSFRIRPR